MKQRRGSSDQDRTATVESRDTAPGRRTLVPPRAVGLDQLGAGAPIDPHTAARMGNAFGGERFDDVRIHTGLEASTTTRALGADALAVGSHIAFASGELQPGTPTGDHLLAHELAHVLQQRGSEPLTQRRAAEVESATAPHERDADGVADAVVARLHGGAVDRAPIRPTLSAGLGVQRGGKGSKPVAPPAEPAPRHEPAGPSDEDKAEEITRASTGLEATALRVLKQRARFKHWSDEQIKRDADMRDGMRVALDEAEGERAISRLVMFDMCESAVAARQAILADYDRRHPEHAPHVEAPAEAPAAAVPEAIQNFSFRFYHRTFHGTAALVAAIIQRTRNLSAADYGVELIERAIATMADQAPPAGDPEAIVEDRTSAFARAALAAYDAAVSATDGVKGTGTQLGNTQADYSGVMKF